MTSSGIQRVGGLVEDNDFRSMNDRDGELDELPHAE